MMKTFFYSFKKNKRNGKIVDRIYIWGANVLADVADILANVADILASPTSV
jgi:hypothetical protein